LKKLPHFSNNAKFGGELHKQRKEKGEKKLKFI